MTRRRELAQRLVDLVLAAALLLLTAPIWPIAFAAIRMDSPGPALFRARRVGRGAAEFSILKFRSMTDDRATSGPAITVGGDPRVTRVGRVLRLTKADELPQLLNVLRGDMSIVGWRPEDPLYLPHYDHEMAEIFRYRPGITGPASLAFRHEEAILARHQGDVEDIYLREILPTKVAIDLAYCRRATVRSDLAVLARTVVAVAARG